MMFCLLLAPITLGPLFSHLGCISFREYIANLLSESFKRKLSAAEETAQTKICLTQGQWTGLVIYILIVFADSPLHLYTFCVTWFGLVMCLLLRFNLNIKNVFVIALTVDLNGDLTPLFFTFIFHWCFFPSMLSTHRIRAQTNEQSHKDANYGILIL